MNRIKSQWLSHQMRLAKVDAAVLWRPEELVALLGYYPFLGLSFATVTAEGETVLYAPDNEPDDSLPEGVTINRFSCGMLPCDPWVAVMKDVRARLCARTVAWAADGNAALCGLAAENPGLPNHWSKLLSSLALERSVDCTELLHHFLSQKNEADLAALHTTHLAMAAAIDVFYQSAEEGISERELQCKIENAIACFPGQKHFARGWAQLQSGKNSAFAGRFNRSSAKRLTQGELVVLEFAACVDGYWGDLTRTACVGAPSDEQQELYAAVKQAQEDACRTAQAGVQTRQVYQVAYDALHRQGLAAFFPHALGHGVGFRYHDHGAGLTPFSQECLHQGNVITIEPGIYDPSFGGMRTEDNFVVTDDGCQKISLCRSGLRGEHHDERFPILP